MKSTARELLETLKRGKLVLDWRKRQRPRTDVRITIEKVLDEEGYPGYTCTIRRHIGQICVS